MGGGGLVEREENAHFPKVFRPVDTRARWDPGRVVPGVNTALGSRWARSRLGGEGGGSRLSNGRAQTAAGALARRRGAAAGDGELLAGSAGSLRAGDFRRLPARL